MTRASLGNFIGVLWTEFPIEGRSCATNGVPTMGTCPTADFADRGAFTHKPSNSPAQMDDALPGGR
jgi:hypothetical protein